MHLIRVGAIEKIDWLLRRYGQNPNTLLANAGLSEELLRDPETLVSYKKLADLLDYCGVVCDQPQFGLHLAQIQSPLVLGELAALLVTQRNLRDSLAFAQKFIHLHGNGIQFTKEQRGDMAEIHIVFDFQNDSGLRQITQMSVGQLYEYICLVVTGQKNKVTMHITDAIPNDSLMQLGSYKDCIENDSHFNGVSFPDNWLDVDLAQSQLVLQPYYQKRIAALDAQYPDNLSQQVKSICAPLIATGECTIENVAKALGVEVRTLQRNLNKENHNFRNLLTELRLSRAQQFLRNTRLPVTDIALNLGYAETAIFSRNFKKWTGKTPLQWRHKLDDKSAITKVRRQKD